MPQTAIRHSSCSHNDGRDCHAPHGQLLSAIIRQSLGEAAGSILQIVGSEAYRTMSYEQIGFLVAHVQEDGQVLPDGIEDEEGNYDPEMAETISELVKMGALVETKRRWFVPCVVYEKHAEKYRNRRAVFID